MTPSLRERCLVDMASFTLGAWASCLKASKEEENQLSKKNTWNRRNTENPTRNSQLATSQLRNSQLQLATSQLRNSQLQLATRNSQLATRNFATRNSQLATRNFATSQLRNFATATRNFATSQLATATRNSQLRNFATSQLRNSQMVHWFIRLLYLLFVVWIMQI